MAQTSDNFTSDGVVTDYTYTFAVEGSFNTVKVGVKSPEDADYVIQVEGTDYTHTSGSKLISFLSGSVPANLDLIVIYRSTGRTRPVDFSDGSTLTASTLDNDGNRSATVDEEIEDRVPLVRLADLLAADMPTSGTPTTVDMGIAADLLIIQGKFDGTHDVTYTILIPTAGSNRRSVGTPSGDGTNNGPDLTFELNSDDTKIDLTFNAANDFAAWTEVKMIAEKFPVTANLT